MTLDDSIRALVREEVRAALRNYLEVMRHYWEWNGIEHDDYECPEDDTCECPGVREIQKAEAAARAAMEPPCPDCHGTGQEGTGQPSDEGGEAFQACAKCNGSGLAHGLYPYSDSCAECGGDGRAYPTPMHREAAASIALDRDQTHYVGDDCPGGHRGEHD